MLSTARAEFVAALATVYKGPRHIFPQIEIVLFGKSSIYLFVFQ